MNKKKKTKKREMKLWCVAWEEGRAKKIEEQSKKEEV